MTAQQLFQFPTLITLVDALAQQASPIDALKLSKLESLFDELEQA